MTDKKIKILYLIERLARAGTELHMLKMLKHLDRSRFEPIVCCLSRTTTDETLIDPDIKHYFLSGGWNLVRPAFIRVLMELRKVIATEQPDLIHSYLFVSNVAAPIVARKSSIKGVIATRGRMGIEWKSGLLHRVVQHMADRYTDRVICKTEAIRKEIIKIEKTAPEKVCVIPNGVDMSHFDFRPGEILECREMLERDHGVSSNGPLILAVGNLKPIKGHISLIRAIPLLLRSFPNLLRSFPNLQVAIVGKGESEEELRQTIGALGLKASVHLPGAFEDVRPWMRASDLFISTSVSEGMPNAVLEAVAMGIPLVLSNIPGHVEAAGSFAWYYASGDSEDLARVLIEALSDPMGRAERSRAGYKRLLADFSLERMVERTQDLYIDVLNRSSRA
jgi:glycosyltransferase involved in cell wall biosynthesis